MKRSEFLKRLAVGIVAIPVAGKILTEKGAKAVSFLEVDDTPEEFYPDRNKYGVISEKKRRSGQPYNGWPLRINDIVCIADNQYLVTKVGGDIFTGKIEWAECTPLKDGPVVYATKDTDKLIRFGTINPGTI